ncbi:hypothetical protein VP1G_11218 [Cytospora mali]|uniref:Uncharacterized protein n=1 Tax=Cytospora mali TaxID=578113 RepID=A0A194V9L3_CYTMA|nr:hypothetical protein VP1G_11218 [Valsa mali var. pyri (nom. inval.)]
MPVSHLSLSALHSETFNLPLYPQPSAPHISPGIVRPPLSASAACTSNDDAPAPAPAVFTNSIAASDTPAATASGAWCVHSYQALLTTATRLMASSRASAGMSVLVRTAPRKAFQPSATGGECRRVRSRGWRGRGARRSVMRSTIAWSSGVLVGGGLGT